MLSGIKYDGRPKCLGVWRVEAKLSNGCRSVLSLGGVKLQIGGY